MFRKISIITAVFLSFFLLGPVSLDNSPWSVSIVSAQDVWAASKGDNQYYIMTDTINGPRADVMSVKVKKVRNNRLLYTQVWNYRGDEGEICCVIDRHIIIGPIRNTPIAVAILQACCDYVESDFAHDWGY